MFRALGRTPLLGRCPRRVVVPSQVQRGAIFIRGYYATSSPDVNHHPYFTSKDSDRCWKELVQHTLLLGAGAPPTPLDPSEQTAPYYATDPPPLRESPQCFISDHLLPPGESIHDRLHAGLQNGITSILPRLASFPRSEFEARTQDLAEKLEDLHGASVDEPMVHIAFGFALNLARCLAKPIFAATNHQSNFQIKPLRPEQKYSQQGDRDVLVTDHNSSTVFSVEMKCPGPLIKHGPQLTGIGNLNAQVKSTGHEAMAIKVDFFLDSTDSC